MSPLLVNLVLGVFDKIQTVLFVFLVWHAWERGEWWQLGVLLPLWAFLMIVEAETRVTSEERNAWDRKRWSKAP